MSVQELRGEGSAVRVEAALEEYRRFWGPMGWSFVTVVFLILLAFVGGFVASLASG